MNFMPSLNHSIIAFSLAAGFLSTSASAAVSNAGTLTTIPYTTFFNVSGAGTPQTGAPLNYFDSINFTIGGSGDSSVSAAALSFFSSATSGFSYLGGNVFTGSTTGTVSGLFVTGFGSPAGFDTSLTLAPGQYHIDFVGTVKPGATGGNYFAALSAAPVPEPDTVSMFLAGLGLIGFLARRRSKSAV